VGPAPPPRIEAGGRHPEARRREVRPPRARRRVGERPGLLEAGPAAHGCGRLRAPPPGGPGRHQRGRHAGRVPRRARAERGAAGEGRGARGAGALPRRGLHREAGRPTARREGRRGAGRVLQPPGGLVPPEARGRDVHKGALRARGERFSVRGEERLPRPALRGGRGARVGRRRRADGGAPRGRGPTELRGRDRGGGLGPPGARRRPSAAESVISRGRPTSARGAVVRFHADSRRGGRHSRAGQRVQEDKRRQGPHGAQDLDIHLPPWVLRRAPLSGERERCGPGGHDRGRRRRRHGRLPGQGGRQQEPRRHHVCGDDTPLLRRVARGDGALRVWVRALDTAGGAQPLQDRAARRDIQDKEGGAAGHSEPAGDIGPDTAHAPRQVHWPLRRLQPLRVLAHGSRGGRDLLRAIRRAQGQQEGIARVHADRGNSVQHHRRAEPRGARQQEAGAGNLRGPQHRGLQRAHGAIPGGRGPLRRRRGAGAGRRAARAAGRPRGLGRRVGRGARAPEPRGRRAAPGAAADSQDLRVRRAPVRNNRGGPRGRRRAPPGPPDGDSRIGPRQRAGRDLRGGDPVRERPDNRRGGRIPSLHSAAGRRRREGRHSRPPEGWQGEGAGRGAERRDLLRGGGGPDPAPRATGRPSAGSPPRASS